MATNTRVILARYVNHGPVTPDVFVLDHSQPLPTDADLKDGEVLIENAYVSVDPYMRNRFREQAPGASYIPGFKVGEPVNGGAVGKVVASKSDAVAAGDFVVYSGEWKTRNIVPAKHVVKVHVPPGVSLSYYLGILGMPGRTSYLSLNALAPQNLKAGNTIFVSAAAGAVGAAVGQLAKHYGLRVIGSAGSAEKVKLLTETLGFDAAFNYNDFPTTADLVGELRRLAPQGINIYYDNVGGKQLDAALVVAAHSAEFIECGMISVYDGHNEGIKNLTSVIGKDLTIRGFIVSSLAKKYPDIAKKFEEEMPKLVLSGVVSPLEEVEEGGWEKVGVAFERLMKGHKIGKLVVKVGEV